MSASTTTKAIAAHTNGVPLIGKTKEFKPPIIEKKTDSVTEGRFIEGTRVNGYKINHWSFKQEGMTTTIAKQLGLGEGDSYSLTFKESVEDEDGKAHTYVHELTGQITKASKEASKTGDEDVWSVEGFANTYKLTVDKVLVIDFNFKTQKAFMNGKDQLAEHVTNVS